MASSLADILQDPNYVNANDATKKAIFDKFSAQDTNYTGANEATQKAIRVKFGVETPAAASAAAPGEGMPAARTNFGGFMRHLAGEADVALGLPGKAVQGLAGLVEYGATRLPYVSEAGMLPGASPEEAAAAQRRTTESLSGLAAPYGTLFGVAGTPEYEAQLPNQILSAVNTYGIEPTKNLLAFTTGMPPQDANALVDTTLFAATGPVTRGVGAGVGAVRRGVGAVRSALSPEIQAGQLARATLNNDPAAIAQVQAANIAQPDVLASQAAAALPKTQPVPAYQALLRTAEKLNPLGKAAVEREAKHDANIAQLDQWAGGATKTEQLATGKAGLEALNKVTTSMSEQELAAAGEANRVLPGLQATAERFGKAAESKVEDVRRFTAAADRANEWARNWAPGGRRQPGAPIPPTKYTYPGELAGRAEAVATKSAEDSLLLGQMRRDAEERMASLEAHGLRPLNVDSLTGNLRSMLKEPEIRYNPPLSDGLSRIIDMLQDAKETYGQVTPEVLAAIRKNGTNSVIEKLTQGSDITSKNKFAASMLSKVNPLIDDAIVKAGGTGWTDYLDTYAKGREALNTQTLFGKLSEMYKNNKKAFVNVVEGNDPELVRETLGGNKLNIKDALGDKYAKVRQMADYIKSEQKITKTAREGGPALTEIMAERNKPMMNQMLSFMLGPKVVLTNALVEGLRGSVNAKVMSRISEAAKSGRSMNDLLNTLPYNERVQVMNAFQKTPGGEFMLNTLGGGATVSAGQQNALAQ